MIPFAYSYFVARLKGLCLEIDLSCNVGLINTNRLLHLMSLRFSVPKCEAKNIYDELVEEKIFVRVNKRNTKIFFDLV